MGNVADNITNNKHREIIFEDIAGFLESKAGALNNTVLEAINTKQRNQGKASNNCRPQHSNSFVTLGGGPESKNNEDRCDSTKATSY